MSAESLATEKGKCRASESAVHLRISPDWNGVGTSRATVARTALLLVLLVPLFVLGGCRERAAERGFPGGRFRVAFEHLADSFQTRIEQDPRDASAFAGLAEAQCTLWCFGFAPRALALPPARSAAQRALELDPRLAAAHTALGIVRLCDWDWTGAEQAFRKAVEIDPADPKAHHWYALFLAALGETDQALHHASQAERLAPESAGFKIGKGAVLYFGHRFEAMRDQMSQTVALAPDNAWAHDWLGMAYVQLQDCEKAVETYERAVDLSDRTAEVLAGLGHAYGICGLETKAREVVAELAAYAEKWYVPSVQRSYVHFGLGETDEGFALLERAFTEKSWELVFLREEPWFDAFRADARFKDLERRMRLPPRPGK